MKASLISLSSSSATNGQLLMMILIALLVFVASSATTLSNSPPFSTANMPDASPTIVSRRHRPQPPHREAQLHPCDALTRENSRSLCIHLHRVYHHRLPFVHVPPLSPPLLTGNKIDPRYGVEKRLVPSGPNPLHN